MRIDRFFPDDFSKSSTKENGGGEFKECYSCNPRIMSPYFHDIIHSIISIYDMSLKWRFSLCLILDSVSNRI